MHRITRTTAAALACCMALGAMPAGAVTISNPQNDYSSPYLSGDLSGGNQTQFFGETFTTPITGTLTNFQLTLNTSNLQFLYGIVYAWNGVTPTTELWRSPVVSGAAGLKSFSPIGVSLTQGQTYVAFLSTYGLAGNSGLATVGVCRVFTNACTSNTVPGLGTLVFGNILGDGPAFNTIANNSQDATFAVTIDAAAVPEVGTWAMMILGVGGIGYTMRRRATINFANVSRS